MKKEIPELKRLELNKQNVMKVLFDCKATAESKKTQAVSFYDSSSSRKAPPVLFDLQKVYSYYFLIAYLLGQVKGLHEKRNTISPAEGIFNYKGEKWTDDNRALFALYYLGCAATTFPKFIDGEKNAITPPLEDYYSAYLTPTYSPSDPNFKLESARKALKNLGVKLPEDLSELD